MNTAIPTALHAPAKVSPNGQSTVPNQEGAVSPPVLVQEYDEAGQLCCRSTLRGGVLDGLFEHFWPNGSTKMRAPYVNGKMDGVLCLFDEKGEPVQHATYRLGLQHGTTRIFALGRCICEQPFRNGLLHGEAVSYDEAGQPTSRLRHHEGVLDGLSSFFFEGKLMRQVAYRAGLMHGQSTDFDQDGVVVQSCHYKANVLDGPLRRYWPNGQLREEILYLKGVPKGAPERFDIDGHRVGNAQAPVGLLARLEKMVRG